MPSYRRLVLLPLPIVLATAAGSAHAAPQTPTVMSLGAATDAPKGFVEMCGKDAEFCGDGLTSGDANLVTGALSDRPMTLRFARPSIALALVAPLSVWGETVGAHDQAPAMDQPSLLRMPAMIAPLAVVHAALASATPAPTVASFVSAPRPAWTAPPLCAPLAMLASASAPQPDPQSDPAAVQPARIVTAVVPRAASAPTPTDRQERALLKRVNGFVNVRVHQRTDISAFGRGELWRRSGVGPGATGDCEDIAIEKRHQLIAAGFPADRLSFAVVYAREVGLHTVLVARSGNRDWVLDSRNGFVLAWNKIRYSWVSAQNPANPAEWRRVTRDVQHA